MKRPSERPRLDGIDVREPGQVADDRADRAAAATPGRERVPRRVAAADLVRDVARELEHLVVEEEEAGEPELVDQPELVVEARAGVALVAVGAAVPLVEGSVADLGQQADGRFGLVREVRVAVAELLRQVELAALGDDGGALDCLPVEREAVGDLAGRAEDRLVVPAPLGLASLRARCGGGSRRARPGAARGRSRGRGRRR